MIDESRRALRRADYDQEVAEARDWLRLVIQHQPSLALAITQYLKDPAEEQPGELSLDQRKTLKRLASIGLWIAMEALAEEDRT